MRTLMLVVAIVLWSGLARAQSCIMPNGPCSNTDTKCCGDQPGVDSCTDRHKTGGRCQPGAGTTAPTTTEPVTSTTSGETTTSSGPTTTENPTTTTNGGPTTTATTPPPTTTTLILPEPAEGIEFPALRFPPSELGLFITTDNALIDPRNGLPADQYALAVKIQQMNWEYLPVILNGYPVNAHIDLVAVRDTLSKFLVNYVQRGGLNYLWGHPTYGIYIPRNIMKSLKGMLKGAKGDLAALLAFGTYMPIEGAPIPYPGDDAGILTELPNQPLTPVQCALLQKAEDTHMAQAMAVLNGDPAAATALLTPEKAAQRAFEESARNLAEEVLFLGIWDPDANWNLDATLRAGLLHNIMLTHALRTKAFNCDTGAVPDVNLIQIETWMHAEYHVCLALEPWVFEQVYLRTSCTDTAIDQCPEMTCRELATNGMP